MDEVESRLFRAYFRRFGKMAYAPSRDLEFFEENGKSYVRLSNVNGTLAVYEIKEDGSLRYAAQ
jgi:hypothetical protein